jgi:hypothetical protein
MPVIPPFNASGLLPEGLHRASETEAITRFGTGSPERSRLGRMVSQWLQLCRSCGAHRFCLDGSFVTAKQGPGDVDAVVLLGKNFHELVARGSVEAIVLAEIVGSRTKEHLFAAEDHRDWGNWIEFFRQTSDPTIRKGLVEVVL